MSVGASTGGLPPSKDGSAALQGEACRSREDTARCEAEFNFSVAFNLARLHD